MSMFFAEVLSRKKVSAERRDVHDDTRLEIDEMKGREPIDPALMLS